MNFKQYKQLIRQEGLSISGSDAKKGYLAHCLKTQSPAIYASRLDRMLLLARKLDKNYL